jgi:uncharacterized protein YqeY
MAEDLRKKLHSDLTAAMRAKDETLMGVLRMVIAAMEKKATELRSAGKGGELSSDDVIGVFRSEVKRRKESRDIFRSGGREDLALKEEKEIEILSAYLPPELSDEEISEAVRAAITETGATSAKDLGIVMKSAMVTLKGRVDGNRVSAVIRTLLS